MSAYDLKTDKKGIFCIFEIVKTYIQFLDILKHNILCQRYFEARYFLCNIIDVNELCSQQKCTSSAVHINNVKRNSSTNISRNNSNLILTNDESCLLRHTKEEYDRRGGWVRIFPTPDSWDVYRLVTGYSDIIIFLHVCLILTKYIRLFFCL